MSAKNVDTSAAKLKSAAKIATSRRNDDLSKAFMAWWLFYIKFPPIIHTSIQISQQSSFYRNLLYVFIPRRRDINNLSFKLNSKFRTYFVLNQISKPQNICRFRPAFIYYEICMVVGNLRPTNHFAFQSALFN